MKRLPLPGSPAAVKAGCECPVMDNRERPDTHKVCNAECPMHGNAVMAELLEAVGKRAPPARPGPSILLEADALIHGERAASYGPVADNWGRTVDIFRALTGIELTVQQGLVFMVAVKLAREIHKPKRDNIRDALGYLALYDEVAGGGE